LLLIISIANPHGPHNMFENI